MDRIPLHILPHVEKPLVGPARIRHGTRCPSLGTDPLEYLQHRPVSALDSGADRKWCGWTVIMVVARSAGCNTGRRQVFFPFSHHHHLPPLLHKCSHHLADASTHPTRLRDDTPANPHPLPRPLHADRCTNTRLPDNNSRASHGSGQNRPWECVSGSLHQPPRRVGLGVVLGGVAIATGRADRLRGVFPEGTVE